MFKKRIITRILSIIDARIERFKNLQKAGYSFDRYQIRINALNDLRTEITETLNFKNKIKHETEKR